MNILFDVVSTQSYMSGGGEYVKRIFYELSKEANIKIYCLYDSSLSWSEENRSFFQSGKSIEFIDLKQEKISDIIYRYSIQKFFIGIYQRFISYDLNLLDCKIIIVIHDIGDLIISDNRLNFLSYDIDFKSKIKLFIDTNPLMKSKWSINRAKRNYKQLKLLIKSNVCFITVSQFTKNALYYYFPELIDGQVKIFFPPEKITTENRDSVINLELEKIVNGTDKIFLLLNADRMNKNADFAIKVFRKLKLSHPSFKLLLTCKTKNIESNIISLDYTSSEDLIYLYKNSFALLYPSISEGFGYPPIEAMRYSLPVLSSNVCSMPEVLEDAAVYFSPFYKADLYNKILFMEENVEEYKKRGYQQYLKIHDKQEKDLKSLISFILS